MSNDDPIFPFEDGGMYIHNVIDLAGFRIQAGRNSNPRREQCAHKKMTYSREERRIWCDECQSTIDNFDALMIIVDGLDEMLGEARSNHRKAWDAMQAVVIRRGAKAIDKSWGRKMAPCCPHCRRGLLPHDFSDGARSAVSIEFENARRIKEREPSNA